MASLVVQVNTSLDDHNLYRLNIEAARQVETSEILI